MATAWDATIQWEIIYITFVVICQGHLHSRPGHKTELKLWLISLHLLDQQLSFHFQRKESSLLPLRALFKCRDYLENEEWPISLITFYLFTLLSIFSFLFWSGKGICTHTLGVTLIIISTASTSQHKQPDLVKVSLAHGRGAVLGDLWRCLLTQTFLWYLKNLVLNTFTEQTRVPPGQRHTFQDKKTYR